MDWIALLGALGVGALVSTWVSAARDRRAARARVREAIANVEHLRWAPGPRGNERTEQQREALWLARRDLTVAAMIAGLPKNVADEYVRLAAVSWQESLDHWDETDTGGIDGAVADHIEAARDLMVDLVWHPVWTMGKRRFKVLEAKRQRLVEQDEGSPLRWKYETP